MPFTRRWAPAALLAGLGMVFHGTALAQAGEDVLGVGTSEVQFGSLAPIVLETGQISWSIDGLGTTAASGSIQVSKPTNATVRRAFLAAASTGFQGRRLNNNDVTIDGVGITWGISTLSSISSWNHWAEVTSLVKPKIDAAPAGTINFTIGEVSSGGIDGTILAVIFDDPNQTTINTVALMFGAQQVQGDTFAIQLSDPINLANPNLKLDFSLGSSYSYQTQSVTNQYSIVRINGTQISTSAGGQDDAVNAADGNGALITVGGIGDSNSNPPPNQLPVAGPDARRTDDELYSLIPFVATGDTAMTLFSQNPSNDDNIFFAGLFIADAAAIVGEGIVLGPNTATANVGDTASAVATVQDTNGNPIVNRPVTFTIFAGPNAGTTAVVNTDAMGKATFSYVGTGGPGVDEITASFVASSNVTKTSNTVLRSWTTTMPPACALTAVVAGPPRQLEITVQSPNAGLHAVEVLVADNSTVNVPVFPQGDKSPLVVVATKVDQGLGSQVALRITDINGRITECDPVTAPEIEAPDTSVQQVEARIEPSPAAGGCSVGKTGTKGGLWGVLGGVLAGLALLRRRRNRKNND